MDRLPQAIRKAGSCWVGLRMLRNVSAETHKFADETDDAGRIFHRDKVANSFDVVDLLRR